MLTPHSRISNKNEYLLIILRFLSLNFVLFRYDYGIILFEPNNANNENLIKSIYFFSI